MSIYLQVESRDRARRLLPVDGEFRPMDYPTPLGVNLFATPRHWCSALGQAMEKLTAQPSVNSIDMSFTFEFKSNWLAEDILL
jgi:hypothetical protein